MGVACDCGVARGEYGAGSLLRHNELSTYGLLKEFSQPELRDFVYQLIGQGVLAQESLVLSEWPHGADFEIERRVGGGIEGQTGSAASADCAENGGGGAEDAGRGDFVGGCG